MGAALLQEEGLMVDAPAMPRQRPVPESPVSPEEVAGVRQPTLQACVLPPRTFHDQDVFDYEQDAWFAGGWVKPHHRLRQRRRVARLLQRLSASRGSDR